MTFHTLYQALPAKPLNTSVRDGRGLHAMVQDDQYGSCSMVSRDTPMGVIVLGIVYYNLSGKSGIS